MQLSSNIQEFIGHRDNIYVQSVYLNIFPSDLTEASFEKKIKEFFPGSSDFFVQIILNNNQNIEYSDTDRKVSEVKKEIKEINKIVKEALNPTFEKPIRKTYTTSLLNEITYSEDLVKHKTPIIVSYESTQDHEGHWNGWLQIGKASYGYHSLSKNEHNFLYGMEIIQKLEKHLNNLIVELYKYERLLEIEKLTFESATKVR